MGKIFYIMGKSASGKDHIYERLLADAELGLQPLVSCTTRPMRAGEEDGREYWFMDEAALEELRTAGKIIEERTYDTVHGRWHYFTADDGRIDPGRFDYLAIGTLESYGKMRRCFGADVMVPVYIEVRDDIRLLRAVQRERKQTEPRYEELCRRFLADSEDFSEEKIAEAGIGRRFENNADFDTCFQNVVGWIKEHKRA